MGKSGADWDLPNQTLLSSKTYNPTSTPHRCCLISERAILNRDLPFRLLIPGSLPLPPMPTSLTWLGHASWQLKTDKHTILIGPCPDDSPTAPFNAKDATAEFILVSHGHFDHIADAAKIANRTGGTIVSNYEITTWLAKNHGVKNTVGGNLGGGANLPFGRVKLTLAFHSSALPDGSNGGNPCGFLITLTNGPKLYFAAA